MAVPRPIGGSYSAIFDTVYVQRFTSVILYGLWQDTVPVHTINRVRLRTTLSFSVHFSSHKYPVFLRCGSWLPGGMPHDGGELVRATMPAQKRIVKVNPLWLDYIYLHIRPHDPSLVFKSCNSSVGQLLMHYAMEWSIWLPEIAQASDPRWKSNDLQFCV